MDDIVVIKRALISVSDKTNLSEFATYLSGRGVELISTGGTAAHLRDAGLTVRDVSELTGFPEMMDGRVKTLHPKVHGGLLAIRSEASHKTAMKEHGIAGIDLLIVNLYPFKQKVEARAPHYVIVENIDIGGPAMLRSAAKNHRFVTVVCEPSRYDDLRKHIDENGGVTFRWREVFARAAFGHTAEYDQAVYRYMRNYTDEKYLGN